MIAAVTWFVHHIEFAFVVGIVTGIFLVDLGHSIGITGRIRKFAAEHNVIVHFEKLKETLYDKVTEIGDKHPGFMFPFKLLSNFKEELTAVKEKFSKENSSKKKQGRDDKQN